MKCPHCGYGLRVKAKYCPSCGREVTSQHNDQTSSAISPPACPVDRKDDAIAPISAIVTSEELHGIISDTSYEDDQWVTTSKHTTVKSELARLLTRPSEPPKPGGIHGIFWFLVLFVLGFCNLGNLILVSILPGMRALGLLFAIGGIAFIVILTIFCFAYFYSVHKRFLATNTSIYSIEKPFWDVAMERWEKLYYCRRHDIVFDPQSGNHCRPQQLRKFLYDKSGQEKTGIYIIIKHNPLAYLYSSRVPIVEVDGEPNRIGWGGHFIEMAPGSHTIKIYFRYYIWPKCGLNTIDIKLNQGENIRMTYYKTSTAFMPGNITFD